MLDALAKIGACSFEWAGEGDVLRIRGHGGRMSLPAAELYVGNAGTASRFLTTVLANIKSAALPRAPCRKLIPACLPC